MKDIIITIMIVGGVIAVGLGLAYARSAQEARSYRKFCDKPVTTWDALWLDLRIDECN